MKIEYPKRCNSTEVQAEIYRKLKDLGFNVRLEVKAIKCRFDIVIFDKYNNARCIIEAKSRNKNYDNERYYRSVQYKKYCKYGIPVILCCRLEEIDDIITKIELLFV